MVGIARGNGWAWLTFGFSKVPVLETVMRLRNGFMESSASCKVAADPKR
jgi:hypothetical protein